MRHPLSFSLPLLPAFVCLVGLGALSACDPAPSTPDEAQLERLLEGQPDIFVQTDPHYTLEGLEGIHLGQPRDAALEALSRICPETMEYRAGDLGARAWFRGCEFPRARQGIVSVRVGFWPNIDDRVATLEVKRLGLSSPVVSARFRQHIGGVNEEMIRSGFVQMRGERYQMMADWDDGKDGPAHIATGFNPARLDAVDLP